jgi:peroxiredoxin
LKRDYAEIRRSGAEFLVLCPDAREQHREYAFSRHGEELPYLYVADPDGRIAMQYGLLRKEEHPHGGYYERSVWILDSNGVIIAKRTPWKGIISVEKYEEMLALVGVKRKQRMGDGMKPT